MAAKVAQDQNLEKITNRAWRTWWFLFYVLIIPATVAIVSFFLSNYLSRNAYLAMNFTVIATLASFFIVYKLFDKYLENPILKNKASNANFRVHAPFFFSMVALTAAFVILLFTKEQNLFKPLPLIALGVVYSFTWLYYRWKPIDEIDQGSKAFKHAATLEAAARCFHNIIVFFHLAFQFVMISFYMNNPLLWGGIGIPINVIFWALAIKLTASARKQLVEGLMAGRDVTVSFLVFKKNFAQVMVAACASLMIINIFYPLIATPGLFANFSWLMLFIFGLVIAGVLLVKVETYVAIYFTKQVAAATNKVYTTREATVVAPVLNKLSLYATVVLIATSLVMGFVPEIPAATPITVVAVYIMVLGERRARLTEGHWYSYSHLANTICLLASISFGVIPSIPFIQVPLIIQATIFIVALYATIEGYCAAQYLKKHQISSLQDAMAICSFALVAISCYEPVLTTYMAAAGLIGLTSHVTAAVAVAALVAGIVMLLACYRLYRTRAYRRTDRQVKAWFSASFAWIASAVTSMALLGGQHLPFVDPVNLAMATAMWWAGSFMAFVGINCLLGIFFERDLVEVTYRAMLVYIVGIPTLVIYHFPTLAPVLAACIALTITIGYHVKWGVRMGKIQAPVHEKYLLVARPLLVGQLLAMQVGWYMSILDPLRAAYIAVVVTAITSSALAKTDFFKRNTANAIVIAALFFTCIMIFAGMLDVTAGTPYACLVPPILSALFAFIPFWFGTRIGWFKVAFSRIAFINSLIITALVLALPTAIMLDIEARFHWPFNLPADLFYTLLLALGVSSAFSSALHGLGVSHAYIMPFKWGMAWAMAGISAFGATTLYTVTTRFSVASTFPAMASLAVTTFFALNFITIALLQEQQLASKHATSVARRIIYFGFEISLSLLLTLLVQLGYPVSAFPVNLGILGGAWHAMFFAMFGLILASLPMLDSSGPPLHAAERAFRTGCWLVLDVLGCLYITGFLDSDTVLGTTTLFTMLLACTAPATRYFFRQAGVKPHSREGTVGMLARHAFLAASLVFLLERARISALQSAATVNPLLYITLLASTGIYGLLFAAMTGARETRFSTMLLGSLVLVLAIAWLPSMAGITCMLVAFGITARAGQGNERIRWIRTCFLATVLYSVFAWFQAPTWAIPVTEMLVRVHVIEYMACFFIAIVYAIGTTQGKKSTVEGNTASVLGSLLVFLLLDTFTPTSAFHSANISIIVYLSLMAVYFKKAGSGKYLAMLKALALAVIVYLTTGACSLVFTTPGLEAVNATMTFLATYCAASLVIIRFFKAFMLRNRKQTLAPALAAFNVFIPAFLYLLFTYYAIVPVEQPILVLLCVDIGFFLCFFSIGVYRWELTREVWKVGWWLWNAFPVVNFYLIFKAVQGIDTIQGLNLYSVWNISGSGIITLIMVSAMYVPIIRYKIQKYFYPTMLVIWGESLFMIDWLMQNVFAGNISLAVMSVLVIGTGLLLPLLYKWRAWRVMAGAWLFLAASNVLFLHILLVELGLLLGFVLAIELIVTSILGMLYAAIPKSPGRWHVLMTSYASLLAGLWALVYFTIYEVTRHPFISINIAFISIAFSMFSSRYLKVNQVKARALIALILMVNLSLLTFNTLALVPELVLLATFASITVFGGSFYTMNQYKMVFHVDKRIPWAILAIGSALSTSSLAVSAWQAPAMIVGFIFALVTTAFFYKDVPAQVKAVLVPTAPTFLVEQLFVVLLPGQTIVLILLFSTCYLALFQCVVNLGLKMSAANLHGIDTTRMQLLLPRINLVAFIANSVQLSIIVSMLLGVPAVLTLVLPFLLICCQTFAARSGIVSLAGRASRPMTMASGIFHGLIAASIMLLFPIPAIQTPLPPELATMLAKVTVFSTSLFIQLAMLDMGIFKIMAARPRFAIMLFTYAMAFNFIAVYLFINHDDVSLFTLSLCALNLFTMQLWQLAFPARKALAGALKKALYNGILISTSSLASRWISFETLDAVDPTGIASWFMYITLTCLFLVLLNLLLNKTLPKKLNMFYQFSLYAAFQAFLLLSWTRLLPVLGSAGLVSISGLALVETGLAFLPFSFMTRGVLHRSLTRQSFWPFVLLVYLELSMLIYATSGLVLGPAESMLIALGCLFVISIVEFHVVKCLRPWICWVLNLASYLPFMLALMLSWMGNLPANAGLRLVSMLGLVLVETTLAFYVFHVVRHRLVKRAISRGPFAWLILPIYAELSMLAYAGTALALGAWESVLAGFAVLFMLTLLEVYVVKCIDARAGYLINLIAYGIIMAGLAMSWLGAFPATIAGTGLISGLGLLLVETTLAFYVFHVIRHGLVKRAISREPFAWLILPVYGELSALAYAMAALVLGLKESALLGVLVLFLLTLLEIHEVKCIPSRPAYALNLVACLPGMIGIALMWLEAFPASVAGAGLLSVATLILLETILALYPFHVILHRLLSRPMKKASLAIPMLCLFFETAFIAYAAANLVLGTMGSVLAALGCLFLLTLIDMHGDHFLPSRAGYGLNLASYLPFMAAFAISWVEPLPLGIDGSGLLSLGTLALLETLFLFYPFHVIRNNLLKRQARREAFGRIMCLVYLEISFIAYAGAALVLDVAGSLTCAFACLFVLAVVESHGIKCMRSPASHALLIAGWMGATTSGLILAIGAATSSRGLIMVAMAIYTILQQYTSGQAFQLLKLLHPARDAALDKSRAITRRAIGIACYAFVFLALQAFVSGAGLGPITQSLAISFGVFVIALIDRSGLDYFGKRVATVMVEVCWILFSIALTSGAIWLFGDIPALVPAIGLGIDLEIAAAVGFLKEFGSKHYGSRSRIAYRLLIACLYIVLGTWPAFIWTANPLLDTLLVLAMILLFELFLRGDAQGPKAIPSHASVLAIRVFDIGTCCGLAVLVFQGLDSIPGSELSISTSIATLVGIVLLFIPLQPFKKGGLLKQIYWSAFSIACGALTTTVSYNFAFAPVYVHFLFGGLVFFLLVRVILERKDRSATGKFLLNLMYYAVIYATVTGILFGFMRVTLIITLLAIIIFGAILSGMVYFYEKRGTISMKWRLLTSITLIVLIITFMILVVLWASEVPLPLGIINW